MPRLTFTSLPYLSAALVISEEGSTSLMEFLGRPNQLVRAVQLDVNPNWHKLDVDLDKSKWTLVQLDLY